MSCSDRFVRGGRVLVQVGLAPELEAAAGALERPLPGVDPARTARGQADSDRRRRGQADSDRRRHVQGTRRVWVDRD